MFAIETIVKDSFYSFKYERETQNEVSRLFNLWSDIQYLETFFEKHKTDLNRDFYNYISVETAIEQTLIEADELEQRLIKIATQQSALDNEKLQNIFSPLNDQDASKYLIPDYQKTKAKGAEHKSWLRIYAIRIEPGIYIITGGEIKLTKNMEKPHLKHELDKIVRAKQFLIEEGIVDKDGVIEFLEL